jgi:hypothetical protein
VAEVVFADIGPLRVFRNTLQFGLESDGFQIRLDELGAHSSSGDELQWSEVGEYSLDLSPYGKAPRLKAAIKGFPSC